MSLGLWCQWQDVQLTLFCTTQNSLQAINFFRQFRVYPSTILSGQGLYFELYFEEQGNLTQKEI